MAGGGGGALGGLLSDENQDTVGGGGLSLGEGREGGARTLSGGGSEGESPCKIPPADGLGDIWPLVRGEGGGRIMPLGAKGAKGAWGAEGFCGGGAIGRDGGGPGG